MAKNKRGELMGLIREASKIGPFEGALDVSSLGVVRANGRPFRNLTDEATLKVPDGKGGPSFLMIRNFSVIKAYNNADKYALAVGLLADEIAGGTGLVQDWQRPFTKLTFEERQELQKRLSEHGYYDGKFDGKASHVETARSGKGGHPNSDRGAHNQASRGTGNRFEARSFCPTPGKGDQRWWRCTTNPACG